MSFFVLIECWIEQQPQIDDRLCCFELFTNPIIIVSLAPPDMYSMQQSYVVPCINRSASHESKQSYVVPCINRSASHESKQEQEQSTSGHAYQGHPTDLLTFMKMSLTTLVAFGTPVVQERNNREGVTEVGALNSDTRV